MYRIIIISVLLNLVCLWNINISFARAGGFYQGEDKYRGFYWFESKTNKDNSEAKEFHYPTPEEATMAIEMRKKALDDARSQMVELSFQKNVPPEVLRSAIVKYKKLEAVMYDSAIALTYANEMANFTNPEIANLAENPTNVFANKIKRKLDEREKIATVREFARHFDLVLFTNNNCPYSKAFEPVIARFSSNHGFTLEKASLNSHEGKIAQKLGITSTPTLVAVSKDANEMFEITRGMIGLSELEASIVLSSKYSDEKKNQSRNYKNKKSKRY